MMNKNKHRDEFFEKYQHIDASNNNELRKALIKDIKSWTNQQLIDAFNLKVRISYWNRYIMTLVNLIFEEFENRGIDTTVIQIENGFSLKRKVVCDDNKLRLKTEKIN